MIPLPSGVRVWIAAGQTDMRRGMQSLALQVQEGLKRDPHAGDFYVFRGRARQFHLAFGYFRRYFDLDIATRLHTRRD